MNPTAEGSHCESTMSMPRMLLLAVPQTASPRDATADPTSMQTGRMDSIFTFWTLGHTSPTEVLLVTEVSGGLVLAFIFLILRLQTHF